MAKQINDLVAEWRELGPVKWAESEYGFYIDRQPIILTAWQRAALESYEALRESVTTWAVSNIKKTGKTALNAVLTQWRWLALPGQHFTAANDLDQSQARQFAMIVDSVRANPFLSSTVKIGRSELIFEPTGSRLTALASDATGNAGANFLTVSHTEAWGILYEGGIRSWEELTPPPGKWYGLPALRLADSYAGFLGESATWHKLVDRGLAGKRISKEWPIYQAGGLLLFHMEGEEAQRRCFRGTPEEAEAYYTEQRQTLRPNTFDRMHANQRTAAESAFLPEGAWQRVESNEVHPLRPGERTRLVIGVDASTTRDNTALVGVEFKPKTGVTEVRLVRVWKPQKGLLRFGKPTIDLEETLGAEVLRMHKEGQLSAVVADPYQLHSLIVKWEKAGIKVIELAQNAGRVESDQALYDAIVSGSLLHYGDPVLTENVRNAVAVETPRGLRLAKEKTSKKIDAAVALSMAHWGALSRKTQTGRISVEPDWMFGPYERENILYDPLTGNGWDAGYPVNRKPHPEGVTWQNCPHNAHGCQTCVNEMEEDGTWQKIREQDEFYEQQAKLGGELPDPWENAVQREADAKKEEFSRMIWNTVRNNLKEKRQ